MMIAGCDGTKDYTTILLNLKCHADDIIELPSVYMHACVMARGSKGQLSIRKQHYDHQQWITV